MVANEYQSTITRLIPLAIYGSGALLLVWSLLEPVGLVAISSPDVFKLRYGIGYVTIVPSCLGLVWGGRWLAKSDVSADYDRTVGSFVLLGGAGFLVFNVFLMLFFPTESIWIVANWVRWALSMGLGVGLVVGISYSRGLSERITAERHSLRAEYMQEQRDLVNQMNDILRHEVLNAAQVVHGNAALLRDADERIDPADERIERIYHQGEELTDVVREVRALLDTIEEERSLETVQLGTVLDGEIRTLRSNHPDIEVETDVPADLTIEADELLGRVFGNLLRNAAEHNDPDSLRITVEADVTADSVVVTIRDDGDGIAETELETLFDRPQVGTHGLGLYLVNRLVESYGGTVTLAETGPDGTTFRLEFPRASTVDATRSNANDPPVHGDD